jgi:hypothetical protein
MAMTSKHLIKTIGQAFICLSVFSFWMTSCKCSRTSEIVGPAACPSANFSYSPLVVKDNTSGKLDTLDLSNSFANVSVTFNESISYTFIITGQTSGAIFKLNGTGAAINYNWYGNSTNGKYFTQGEVLSYALTNLCKTEALGQYQIYLSTIISYAGFGVKVINFEDNPAVSTSPSPAAPLPSQLMTPLSNGYDPSPQGGNYYHYQASVTQPTWYFDYMTFNGISYSNLGSDPSKVYLNFFAKGKVNSLAQMIIDEMAHGTKLTRKFYASVSPDGWKLFSVRLSDIGIINPSQIKTLSVNFAAGGYQDTSCEIDLDLVLFTKDQPF